MITYLFFIIGFILGDLLALFITNIMWIKNQKIHNQYFINYLYFIQQNLKLILFNYDIVMRQDLFDDLNDLHDNIKKVIDTGNNYD